MFIKLKYKIALLQLLVGCSIVLLGVTVHNKFSTKIIDQKTQDTLQTFSQEVAQQINSVLHEKAKKINTLGSAPVVKQLLRQSNTDFSFLSPNERDEYIAKLNRQWVATKNIDSPFLQPYLTNSIAKYFLQQFALQPDEYGEIFLTNRYGALVASTGKLTTLAHGHKYWWRESYNKGKGKTFFDDRGFDASVKGYVLGIVVPIKQDGVIIGILKANIRMQGTLEEIVDYSSNNHRQTWIVRDNGLIVLQPGAKPLSSTICPAIGAEMDALNGDTSFTFNKNNSPYFAAISSILITQGGEQFGFGGKAKSIDHSYGNQGEGWNIVTTISQADSQQLLLGNRQYTYLITLIAVMFLALVAFYAGNHITKPLVSLTAAAKKIGTGDFTIKLDTSSQDELGEVAQSFNKMSESLATTMATKDQYHAEIQQRQLSETALKDSEAKLKEAQRIAKTGSWHLDLATNVLNWSDEVYRIFDLTPQQFGATYEAFIEQIHPQDREMIDNAYTESVKNKTPYEIAHRLLLRDGTIKFVNERGETFYDDAGQPTHSVGTVQDLTKQKMAEENLHLYTRILATTDNHMSVIDRNYIYIAVNQAYLNGFKKLRQEIIGQSVKNLLGADKFEKVVKYNLDRALAGEEIRYQAWFEFPETGRRYMDVKYHPYIDTDDAITGVVVSSHDITEIKQMEAQRLELELQLRQKYKVEAIGVMAGGIAHNFNNNLSIILGNVELAQLKQGADSEAIPLLANAKTAVMHSRNLVQQIINFTHQRDNNKTAILLPLVIDETLKLLQSTIPSTVNIQQDIGSGCDDTYITGDTSQIQEILINLCNNAVQALNENGKLTISLKIEELTQTDIPLPEKYLPGYYAKLGVQDNGTGMTAEIQEKIFDPFFTTKKSGEGSGIGLSTVQDIVEQHDGFIKVKSIVGEGTIFELYFPIIERRQKKREEIVATMSSGNEKILFLDDEEMLVNVWGEMLREFGYQVTTMTNSAETLKILTANPDYFDLLITDQTMPELSGTDLIKELHNIKPELKTILCTGYSNQVNAEEAEVLGIKAFCMKPLDHQKLIQTVRQVLDEERS